jgi:hypothetical protein
MEGSTDPELGGPWDRDGLTALSYKNQPGRRTGLQPPIKRDLDRASLGDRDGKRGAGEAGWNALL